MRRLTDEESEFIRSSTYPLWVTRENFRERFGWCPNKDTFYKYGVLVSKPHGHSRYSDSGAPGKTVSEYAAVRKEYIRTSKRMDRWRKEHS